MGTTRLLVCAVVLGAGLIGCSNDDSSDSSPEITSGSTTECSDECRRRQHDGEPEHDATAVLERWYEHPLPTCRSDDGGDVRRRVRTAAG